MIKVSIIVPFFNEESIIQKNVTKIYEYCKKNLSNFEIIFVDDGSTDSSYFLVKDAIKDLKFAKIVRNKKNEGRGMAIKNGLGFGKGNIIGYIDCDLEIKLTYIPEALELLKKFDVVIASKFKKGAKVNTPFIRKLSSRAYNYITRFILQSKVSDHQAGFKFFRKECIEFLLPLTKENGWLWDTEVLYLVQKKGYTFYELPIDIRYGYRKIRASFFLDFVKLPSILLELKNRLDKNNFKQ